MDHSDYGTNPAYPDIEIEVMKQRIDELVKSKQVFEKKQQLSIEASTIGQSSNPRWLNERMGRITASNAGYIFALRDISSNKLTLDRLLKKSSIDNLASIQHGSMYEGQAKRAYENKTGRRIQNCGLFVSLENGIFAASPDGLVGEDGIVEIKCPSTLVGFPPTEMPFRMKTSYLIPGPGENKSQLSLNRSSLYYKQVVMQLHVTGRQWCDFVVYSFKLENGCPVDFEPFIERIWLSEDTKLLWNRMKDKLTRFFMEDMAPEVVDSRAARNMPYRIPDYRKEAWKKLDTARSDNRKEVSKQKLKRKSANE